jgi:hypothetical protein
MKFFELMQAADLSQHDIVFLSDVTGDDRVFSVESVEPFALGEILSITERSQELFFKIRANSGVYEVSAFGWHKFAVYEPEKIPAKHLSVGDQVLLRGKHCLPSQFLATAAPMSCISEVLEIVENNDSVFDVKFRISRPISTRIFIGGMQLPFGRRPTQEIRMFLPVGAPMEMSHEHLRRLQKEIHIF